MVRFDKLALRAIRLSGVVSAWGMRCNFRFQS